MKNPKKFFKNNIAELFGALLLLLLTGILFALDIRSGIVSALGLAVYCGVGFVLFRSGLKKKKKQIAANAMAPVLNGLLDELDSPVMIVNEANRIVWSNTEFDNLPEVKSAHLSSGAGNIFNGDLSYLKLKEAYDRFTDFIDIVADGRHYGARVFPSEFDRRPLMCAVLYDHENYLREKKKYEDSMLRVAHIVVDNTSEVSQDVDRNTRFGSAAVHSLLTEWASSIDAILTEYERDRYIMMFENRHIDKMQADKFDILDKVGQLSNDEYDEKITISIGVSNLLGSIEDRRICANEALRLALQRGGALAVLKLDDGEIAYGGKTKAVQRQTKIRSRLCKDLLLEQIPRSKNVIIMGHGRPDYDSIASNIGIAKLVSQLGVTPYIIADKEDKNISRIFSLIEKYPEYDEMFVDAVFAQDIMSAEESLLIVTDSSSYDTFASRDIFDLCSRIIIIDHHASNQDFSKKIMPGSIIDPTASSASELVCEILELSLRPESLRPEEAQILLTGIMLDTQFFMHDTGTRTYGACIFLKSAGADVAKVQAFFKSDLNQFRAVSKIENTMEYYRDAYAISVYTDSEDDTVKVTASKAADRLVNIEGIAASFIIYTQPKCLALSARSSGEYNVKRVAEELGGGGHFQSAGAVISKKNPNYSKPDTDTQDESAGGTEEKRIPVTDVAEAIALLKEAIDKFE